MLLIVCQVSLHQLHPLLHLLTVGGYLVSLGDDLFDAFFGICLDPRDLLPDKFLNLRVPLSDSLHFLLAPESLISISLSLRNLLSKVGSFILYPLFLGLDLPKLSTEYP